MFEIDWSFKYAEVGKAWFSAIAVLERCCWVAILVIDVLGGARIDSVDNVGMCMVEESAAMSGSIQEDVCSIVDLVPFGFTYSIHLLIFWVGCFKINSKVIECCDEFC
jgi:hypothetical protein